MRWATAAYWHLVLTFVLMLVGGYAGFEIAAAVMPTHARRAADDPSWRINVIIGGLVGFFGTGLLLIGLYAWLARRERRPDDGARLD